MLKRRFLCAFFFTFRAEFILAPGKVYSFEGLEIKATFPEDYNVAFNVSTPNAFLDGAMMDWDATATDPEQWMSLLLGYRAEVMFQERSISGHSR